MGNTIQIKTALDDKAKRPLKDLHDAFLRFQKDGAKGVTIGASAAVTAKAFDLVGKSVMAVGDFIGDTVMKGVRFERGMLNINSIAKVSQTELAAMGKSVLKMSGEFGQSADTMTDALYDINSSGFAGSQGLDVLRAASKAATAGLATTAEAASGITAVLNAYGLKAADSAHVSDILFKTVERGVITFPELSAEIGKTTALAAPLGVSLDEVGAGLAVMTRHGVDAENATTQLNAIMSSMLQPSAQAAALAKQLGLDWSVAGLRANGLAGSLQLMIDKTGGAEDEMAVLLGDARAIRGAFSLAAGGGKELNDELAIMKGAAGATEAAFGIQSQGAAFKMAQASAKLDAALTELGENALPLLAEAATDVAGALDAVGEAFEKIKPFTDAFGNGVGAITGGIDGWAQAIDHFLPYQSDLLTGTQGTSRAVRTLETDWRTTTDATHEFTGKMADDHLTLTASAKDMATGTEDAYRRISNASGRAAKDLLGDIDRIIEDGFDVLIAKDELAANSAELSALRRKVASGKATAEEIADLHKSEQTQAGLLTELATHGKTQSKQYKDAMKILLKELGESHGAERKRIEALILKLSYLEAAAKDATKAIAGTIAKRGYVNAAGAAAAKDGKASGGPVKANTAYIVGEEGPELFVPGTSGSIVPNGGSNEIVAGGAWGGAAETTVHHTHIYLDGRQIAETVDEYHGRMLRRAPAIAGY